MLSLVVSASLFAQAPTTVFYTDDFQSYAKGTNPPGWVDTSVGNPAPAADGLYKTWPDPTQGNKASNIVYGTQSSSGKPEGRNPRIGTFSTLTSQDFDAKGRFEYSGRFLRMRADGRVGVVFLSQYPVADKYYLLGLWSQPASSKLTMQLFAFDKSLETSANPLGDQSERLEGARDSGVSLDLGKWYRFLIRVDDTDGKTRISASIWPDGTLPPDSFQIVATDAAPARLTTGHIGLWSAVRGDNYVDEILAKSPVDASAPQIAFFRNTPSGEVPLPDGFETNENVTVVIHVTDDVDPHPTSTATLDDQPFTSGSTVTAEGAHVIRVHATDSAGNTAIAKRSFLIDKTKPTVQVLEGTTPLVAGTMLDREVSINLAIDDVSSTTVTATMDGAPFVPGTPLDPASLYGVEKYPHVFLAKVTDRVGNVATVGPVQFTIDLTPPTLTILKDGASFSGGAFNTDVVLDRSYQDMTPTTAVMMLDGAIYTPGTPITADGEHAISAVATDAVGHETPAGPISFVINKTGPSIRFLSGTDPLRAGGYYNTDIAARIEVTDISAPVVTATLDGAEWPLTLVGESGDVRLYGGPLVTAEGPHTLAIRVRDAAGNDIPSTVTFTIDRTKPVVAILEDGTAFPHDFIFNRDVVAKVDVSDAVTHATVAVTLDGADYVPGTAITEEKVGHVITATATDQALNTATDGPITFTIDKTNPVVSLLDGDRPFPAGASINHSVALRLEISDLTEVTIAATLDGAAVTFTRGAASPAAVYYDGPVVSAEGEHTITVLVTDAAGLPATLDSVHFTIDLTPPVITLTSPSAGDAIAIAKVTATGGSDDAVTVTVGGTSAAVDRAAKTWTSAELSLLEGANVLTITGVDAAGNTSTITPTLIVDTRGPALAVASPPNGACVKTNDVIITGTATDARLAGVTAKIGSGGETAAVIDPAGNWTVTIPGAPEGMLNITLTATDTVGHQSVALLTLRVDSLPPAIEVTSGGAPFTATVVNRPIALFVRAADADPSAQITALLDGATFVSGNVVAAEGSHTLVVKAQDCAGNQAQRPIAFRTDLSAPVIGSLTPPNGGTVGSMPASISGSVTSDATRVDLVGLGVHLSAVASNGVFTISGVPFAEGTNRFTLTAFDEAGNSSELAYTMTVKTTAPAVEILENGSPLKDGALFNRDVTPVIRSSDSDATPSATLNGAVFGSGTAITQEGSYTLIATATDSLGHSSSSTVAFHIDKTAPDVVITSPAAGQSIDADHVTVTGTCGDAVSVNVSGVAATPASGNFTAEIALELGENDIVAIGSDAAGNRGRAAVTIQRGGTGPAIVLTYPSNGLVTNHAKSEVIGRVITPSAVTHVRIEVKQDGQPARSSDVAIDAAGDFRLHDASLYEGANTITAIAVALDGTENSVSVAVTGDFTPPTVEILVGDQTLVDGARFVDSQVLTLSVSDPGSQYSQLLVDGTPVSLPFTAGNGGHLAIATARDAAGNETRVERSFTIGTTGGTASGCSVTSLDPAAGSVVYSTVTRLVGRTSAQGLKINGVAVDVVDGSFCATVPLDTEGDNPIPIVCTDASGARIGSGITHTLRRSTGAPSVEITSPGEGEILTATAVDVSGSAGAGVVSVVVNGVQADFSNTNEAVARTFVARNVSIANGVNILAAQAQTAAFRFATATRRVVVLGGQPSISISSPIGTLTTGAATIDVSGTWANLDPETLTATNGSSQIIASSTSASDTTGTFVARGLPLVDGSNAITLMAHDAAGRAVSAPATVIRTTGVPSISINDPADNSATAAASISVHGTAEAADGATIQVNGVAATIDSSTPAETGRSTYTFSADVPLSSTGIFTPVVARVSEPTGAGTYDTIRVTRFTGDFTVADKPFPAQNAVQVPATVQVLVAFSHPVDPSTLAGGGLALTAANGQAVTGLVRLDDKIASFAPAAPLAAGETYTIRIAPTVRDLAGRPLDGGFTSSFTTEVVASSAAPQLAPLPAAACGQLLPVEGTTSPGARVRLDSGDLQLFTAADASGHFAFSLPLSGAPGYHLLRVRATGTDGSLSPSADVCFRIECGGPQVVDATYDSSANTLSVLFSKPVDPATLAVGRSDSITLTSADNRSVTGTAAISPSNPSLVTITPGENLAVVSFTLSIGTGVKDLSGNALTAPYSRTFAPGGGAASGNPGDGYLTGETYDASNGRPLAGAIVRVGSATTITHSRGRYTVFVPEGAHTIEASAPDYTTVWRQAVVAAGVGVVPIDIRLTRRGAPLVSGSGEFVATDDGDSLVTRKVTLTVPSGGLTSATSLALTSVGAQSLAGLLPLGWSPAAAAEISSPLPVGVSAATLIFTVPGTSLTSAAQTLSAVVYDPLRDEWLVAAAVVPLSGDEAVVTLPNLDVTNAGTAVALVYPDKAPDLLVPPPPAAGLPLQGVVDSCATADGCGTLTKDAFVLDPPTVLPEQSTTATLRITSGSQPLTPSSFPSGTAVQAYIDEELRLADGSVTTDAPFAADLLLYRAPDGSLGEALFHLAPSGDAARVALQVGYEHIRVHPYPGRLDRGTLIGGEGGRVPGDDTVAIDIPAGAAVEPIHAEVHAIADLTPFGSIEGFATVAAYELQLSRATQPPPSDLDGDGNPDPIAPVTLLKPASGVFAIDATRLPSANAQLVLAEILDATSYGTAFRLAATLSPLPGGEGSGVRATRFATEAIDPSLPLDGISHEARYLVLAARQPIAFATGLVRRGSTSGPVFAGAQVLSQSLGVTDFSRATGVYNVPTLAGPFALTPRDPSIGTGEPQNATAPAADSIVPLTLVLAPQPPTLTLAEPITQTEVSLKTRIVIQSDKGLDPSTFGAAPFVVKNALTGEAVAGTFAPFISPALQITFTPANDLKPNSRYRVTVSGSVRALNGASLGTSYSFSFATITQLLGGGVKPELIRITFPDANGVSRISALPSADPTQRAVPASAHVIAVRRGRDFTTMYQSDADGNGGFSFPIGTDGGTDRVTINDTIDLQVLDSNGILIAVVRLTPFVTEDGRGFVAQPGVAIRFTSIEGIGVDVPADAFSQPTLVTTALATKDSFNAVPSFDQELNFSRGVELKLDCSVSDTSSAAPCTAHERLQLSFPVTAPADPSTQYLLGLLGESIRGPRVMIVDTLRVDGNSLTTTVAANTKTLASRPDGAITDVKELLVGAVKSGTYAVIDVAVRTQWVVMSGVQANWDLFWDSLTTLYISSEFIAERGGNIAFPVAKDRSFTLTGVDASSGVKGFETPYELPVVTDPSLPSTLPSPDPDLAGPYPVFGTPFRVEIVEMAHTEVDVSGFRLTATSDGILISARVTKPSEKLSAGATVQAMDVTSGKASPAYVVDSAGTVSFTLLEGAIGDRIVLLVGQGDLDPRSSLSIVFSETINLPAPPPGSEPGEGYDSFLRDYLKVVHFPKDSPATPSDLTPHVHYVVDSNGRRVTLKLPTELLPSGVLRLIITNDLADEAGIKLGTARKRRGESWEAVGGGVDVSIDIVVREPRGEIGDFDVIPSDVHTSAGLRDMAKAGNTLFASALDGGLLAYDLSGATDLTATVRPMAFVPAKWTDASGHLIVNGFDAHWAVAVDHHGRIYSTGFTEEFGAIRSYRLEDFLKARDNDGAPETCRDFPLAPPHAVCGFKGAAIVSWRPGYASGLPLGMASIVSDRPEGTPRRLQLLVQDEDGPDLPFDTTEHFVALNAPTVSRVSGETAAGEFRQFDVTVRYVPEATRHYSSRRITIFNKTMDYSWSADVPAGGEAVIAGVSARPGDVLHVSSNLTTYGVVSIFGYGVSIVDLNGMESNDLPAPADYVPFKEQVVLTNGMREPDCGGSPVGDGGIQDLMLTSDAAVIPSAWTSGLSVLALQANEGLVDIAIPAGWGNSSSCPDRGDGLVFHNQQSGYTHPRLKYIDRRFEDLHLTVTPRFTTAVPFHWHVTAKENVRGLRGSEAGTEVNRDYLLIAGGDYGLLVVDAMSMPVPADIPTYKPLGEGNLADVIWLPAGAVSVRTIPGTSRAAVVDKSGRLVIIDLSKIDERWDADGKLLGPGLMFPTAWTSMQADGAASEVGVDDPRILWKSEPGFVRGSLAPVIDPESGLAFSGEVLGHHIDVSSLIDPQLRAVAPYGDHAYREIRAVFPFGIRPPDIPKDPITPDRPLSVFRIEMILPGAAARAIPGGVIRIAVESERVPGEPVEQTSVMFPPAHLRTSSRMGEPDARPTTFELRRLLPHTGKADEDAKIEKSLRHQAGYNKFFSPWIVAIADPRASVRYPWLSDSEKDIEGCQFCDRPAWLATMTDEDGYYELWSGGRSIAARLDGSTNPFAGTPFAYLGEAGRMELRLPTVMGDTVRSPQVTVAAQNPPIAEGMIDSTVYLHSGEIEQASVDLVAEGRAGINVGVARVYRSRTLGDGTLGVGWDSPMFRRLRELADGAVEYRDGEGEIWTFRRLDDAAAAPSPVLDALGRTIPYRTPAGMRLTLVKHSRGWTLFDQQWRAVSFDTMGRIVSESDEFFDLAKDLVGKPSGNVVRYVYDESGRLEKIVDPVGRTTTLSYWSAAEAREKPGVAFAGHLKEVSDWRGRSVSYEYDALGRLTRARLPSVEVAVGVPDIYRFRDDKRPAFEYTYHPIAAPPASEKIASKAYGNFLDYAGNLASIKEPAEVAKTDGLPRVTLTYEDPGAAEPWKRDRVTTETWATGETVTFSPSSADGRIVDQVTTVDALGQERVATVAMQTDRRVHIAGVESKNVGVVVEAEGTLPSKAPTSLTPKPQTLERFYTYDDQGQLLQTRLENGLFISNTWEPAKDGATGSRLTEAAQDSVVTQFGYGTGRGANAVRRIQRTDSEGRNHLRFLPSPHADETTVSIPDDDFETSLEYDDAGRIKAEKTLALTGELSRITQTIYDRDASDTLIARGRPSRIMSGSEDLATRITYHEAVGGGEVVEARDEKRSVATTETYNSHGLLIERLVEGSGSGALHERIGYDAGGRIAYHSREQRGVGEVITEFRYDAMGRPTRTTLKQGAIVGGSAKEVTSETRYDLAHKKVIQSDPYAESDSSSAAVTENLIDALGRTVEVTRNAPGGDGTTKASYGYAILGGLAYQTNGRQASLSRFDKRGRETESVDSYGLRNETHYDEWDQRLTSKASAGTIPSAGERGWTWSAQGQLKGIADGIRAAEPQRYTAFTRLGGGTLTSTRIGTIDPAVGSPSVGRVRVSEQRFDSAGRVTEERVGAASGLTGLIDDGYLKRSMTYAGALPLVSSVREERARGASSYEFRTEYDSLGRAVATSEAAEYDSTAELDEAGNPLRTTASGIDGKTETDFDGRGLPIEVTLPSGRTIAMQYDARGSIVSYQDEAGPPSTTTYEYDGLGRTRTIHYPDPDHTTEEFRYEDKTGLLHATRDRAGQWLVYAYDEGGHVSEIRLGTGDTPDPGRLHRLYRYDAAGRLSSVTSEDATIALRDYDLLGRPGVVTTTRYAKVADPLTGEKRGSGLDDAPVRLDEHVQSYVWSATDDTRTRYRMPIAGDEPLAGLLGPQWREWIVETRDPIGNLIEQGAASERDLDATVRLMHGDSRGAGRLFSRERFVDGGSVKTQYGYADGLLTESWDGSRIPVSGMLISAAHASLGTELAGAELVRDDGKRVKAERSLGLGGRISSWDYDRHLGRLEMSTLSALTGGADSAPGSDDSYEDADFRLSRTISGRLTDAQRDALGPIAATVEPPSWAAEQNAAHQISKVMRSSAKLPVEEMPYEFDGGRRVRGGDWTTSYDVDGRVASIESAEARRRIEFAWDPRGRLVGRSAYRSTDVGTWIREDRPDVLRADDLPAETTFVWDWAADRLAAVYQTGASLGGDAAAGLLRQYVYGDLAYDDLLEELVLQPDGTVKRMLPLADEAGTGSVEAVIGDDGLLVERVLYADSYGDAPRYLTAPVVDRITVHAKKTAAGEIEEVTAKVHLSEKVVPSSVEHGVTVTVLKADRSPAAPLAGRASVDSEDPYTVELTLTGAEWASIIAAPGAAQLEIAVTSTLRAEGWGATPVAQPPAWQRRIAPVDWDPQRPVIVREQLATLAAEFFEKIPPGKDDDRRLYEVPDLYLAASEESKAKLLTGFKAAPFVEPATGLVNLRNRWYDPSTGTFLTPDPMGYHDSSNLYAGFANDPVNNSDPTGEVAETVWDIASLGMGVTSLSYNLVEENYGAAALDVFGIALDTVAAATPLLPGGASALIKASRAGGFLAKAHLVDQTINVGQGVAQSYGAIQQGQYGWGTFYAGMAGLGMRGMDVSPYKWEFGGVGSNLGNVRMRPTAGRSAPGASRVSANDRASASAILSTQRELSSIVNRQGAVVDRWLRTSQSRWATVYRAVSDKYPNFAKGIRGRVLDRQMNEIFWARFGDLNGVRIDQTIRGSGSALRPDLYLPSLGGKRVIFEVGGPSKLNGLEKYEGMADYVIPLIPKQWF